MKLKSSRMRFFLISVSPMTTSQRKIRQTWRRSRSLKNLCSRNSRKRMKSSVPNATHHMHSANVASLSSRAAPMGEARGAGRGKFRDLDQEYELSHQSCIITLTTWRERDLTDRGLLLLQGSDGLQHHRQHTRGTETGDRQRSNLNIINHRPVLGTWQKNESDGPHLQTINLGINDARCVT